MSGVHETEVEEVFSAMVPETLRNVYLSVWVNVVAYLVMDIVSGLAIYPFVADTRLLAGSTSRE